MENRARIGRRLHRCSQTRRAKSSNSQHSDGDCKGRRFARWGLEFGKWIGEEAGKALCEHPDIKAIAFVGESRTGSQIMKQGADTLKRVHFELGGKNPVVVFDDADLDRALDAAIFMIYSLNGERCTSSSRLLVQDTIADAFEAKLIERVNAIKVGHPLDSATEVGPLIHDPL